MRDRIDSTIKKHKGRCDYLEVRVESSELTSLAFSRKGSEGVTRSKTTGGAVRACYKGGWCFTTFNSLDDLDRQVGETVSNARSVAKERTRLAEVEPVDVVLRPTFVNDPRDVPLEAKLDLFKGYNDLILGFDNGIVNSHAFYFEKERKRIFANSQGTFIDQDDMDMAFSAAAIAMGDGITQTGHAYGGGKNDYSIVLNQEETIKRECQKALDLVRAPQVKSGKYTAIIDQNLGGVFVHEAFGHQSEADKYFNNPRMKETFKIGRVIGSPVLNIYDTGLEEGTRGHVPYDDEGVPGRKTWLIREGELVGRLHSRESAAYFGDAPTGNARAVSYRFPPICRMRNTCIAAGDRTLEELFDGVDLGVYAIGSVGGSGGEMFTFTADYGYMIRKGKRAELVRDISLSGNLFTTMKNIDAVADDYITHDGPGGCGTRGQMNLPVSHGAPHFRVRDITVGGA